MVGKVLLRQLQSRQSALRSDLGVDLRVMAISTSKKMLLSDTGIDLGTWEQELADSKTATDLDRLGEHMKESYTNAVVIDCTSSEVHEKNDIHTYIHTYIYIHLCSAPPPFCSLPRTPFPTA